MLHKVSVIVPVYKVEKYLNRCLDSILNQTYRNLEIILVDDGSPDNCGKIADNYAKRDNRIKVIHKPNGGLSDARNHGMQSVSGEFTVFVDSDDWLDSEMIEELVGNRQKYDADVVQTAFYYAYDDYLLFDNRYYSKDDPPVILDQNSLMQELVKNEKVKNFAWGKLYKTELIKDIPFEKGVLFEDVFWAHRVMQRVSRYVILNRPKCYYYQRSDSIVATYTPRNLDILKGLKVRHLFIEEFYQDLIDESLKVILKTCLEHYYLLLRNRKKDIGGSHRKAIQRYINENLPRFKKAVAEDGCLKRQLFLFSIHPYLNILFLIGNKIFRVLWTTQQGLERTNLKKEIHHEPSERSC